MNSSYEKINIGSFPKHSIPAAIQDSYFRYYSNETMLNGEPIKRELFSYYLMGEYGPIPFETNWAMFFNIEDRIKDYSYPFESYATGFLEGSKETFIPFIDTPENRKELILSEVLRPQLSFPMDPDFEKNELVDFYSNVVVYKFGFNTGRYYKAWNIVLKNPKAFESSFNEPIVQSSIILHAKPTDRLNPIVISTFCKLVSNSGVMPKSETESIESFCKRVCSVFNLTYSDRVRQHFNGIEFKSKNTKTVQSNLDIVINDILPNIEKGHFHIISKFLKI